MREVIALGIHHLVEHTADFFGGADGAGEGIEVERLLGEVEVAVEAGVGGEVVEAHLAVAEGGHDFGKGAGVGALDSVVIHEAGDFDDAIGGEIRDEAGMVGDVAVDDGGDVLFDGFDDPGAIFEATGEVGGFFALVNSGAFCVLFLSPLGPVVGVEAFFSAVAAGGVFFEEFGAFAVVGEVFAEVSAGFGDECAEVEHHVGADGFGDGEIGVAVSGECFESWVEVFAFGVAEFGEPGEMVDAAALPFHVFVGEAGVFGEEPGCALDAMAEADVGEGAGSVGGEAHDGHGVGVVEDGDARAEFFAVAEDGEPFGDGAEGFEETAGADGVSDALADAVLEGDVIVVADTFEATDFDAVDEVVGAFEKITAIEGGVY